ncbi:hypothetical protein L596_025989 [Steinernema carpocapsae]|uniref:Uncharacterized protein n=1 Tax=Steinernema carpocapsae TaxID=34508 RepID=A0A4U5M005_STECR|nr:hypothetical protein L596_025989 [Steinernema carpocapsae]
MLLNLVQQHRDSSNRPRWGPIYEAYAQWAEGEAMPQRTRAGLQGKLRLLTTQQAQEPPIVAAPPAVVVLDPDNRELQEEPVVLESEVRVDSDAGTESHADSLTLEPLDPLGLSELMSIAEEATEPIMSAAETAT